MNNHLLPALQHTPKELLLGLIINTPPSEISTAITPITSNDVSTQLAYVAQQCLDGYAEALRHATKRKAAFDQRVLGSWVGEVTFQVGDLVQVYRNDLDYTFKSECKLLPKWSPPRRVRGQIVNSYTLATVAGTPITGTFHARRLRSFIPRSGTQLALDQARFLATLRSPVLERPGHPSQELE